MKKSHLLALGMSLLIWLCLLLIIFGCSQKVVHRPRYNHNVTYPQLEMEKN